MAAIDLYLDGDPVEHIADLTGIRPSELTRLIARCVSTASDGTVWGFRALIPSFRIKAYERTSALEKKVPGTRSGYAGVLTQTLSKYPDLYDKLVNKILKRRAKDQPSGTAFEFKITPKKLGKIFRESLRELGVSDTEWPFNTRNQGQRSISAYMKKIINLHADQQVRLYGDSAARAHLSVGTGREAALRFDEVYDVWEIDSHKIDAQFVVGVRNADGLLSYLSIKRINLLALIDRGSKAIVWFLIVYAPEVSASDVVRLITQSLGAKLPAPTTNHLKMFIQGEAGYPSERFPELTHALPAVLMADNALCNLSAKVSTVLRRESGFALNYGPPGHFESRPNIERTFEGIAQAIFQRFPSTTGSSPTNGRAQDSEKIAKTYKVESAIVEELAYHHFAQYNATPNEGLGFLTPLEFIQQKLTMNNCNFMVRRLLADKMEDKMTYKVKIACKVTYYPKKGMRPYITIDRVRYSNAVLRESSWLAKETLTVLLDEEDMRVVEAYLPNGESLGHLMAAGKWARTKHSRKTRQQINSLLADKIATIQEMQDPVEYYLNYLNEQLLVPKANADKRDSKKTSSEYNRLRQEIDDELPLSPTVGAGALDDETVATVDFPEPRTVVSSTSDPIKSLMRTEMPDFRKLLSKG
ncbi:hypothetical protein J3P88_16600 [Pseudomonas sp. Z3-6]|uniref:hypothetical protein n=1 Tax=Pseudomonas sp. Z3-6 TaxID=2817411 RepID=UPI003DA7DF1A